MSDRLSKPEGTGTVLWKSPVELHFSKSDKVADISHKHHDTFRQLQDENDRLSSQLREALIEIGLLRDLVAMRSL